MSRTGGHRGHLARLGLDDEVSARLATYLETLERWGARVNLSGARSAEERVAILVEPVVAVARVVEGPRLLDVGSGNGSPGLVIALLRPDLECCTLLEPRMRRWAFLREAVRSTGRAGVTVLQQRHDVYREPPADTVTVRALRLPLAAFEGLVRPGGLLVAMGPAPEGQGGFAPEGDRPGVRLLRRSG